MTVCIMPCAHFFKRRTRACRDLFTTATFSATTAVLGDLAAAKAADRDASLSGRRRFIPADTVFGVPADAEVGVAAAARERKLRDGVAANASQLSAERKLCPVAAKAAALFFRRAVAAAAAA